MVDTERIRQLREKKGLTLAQAAEAAGFKNRQQWHGIESGAVDNPKLQTIEAVAAALEVKASTLIK